MSVKLFCAFRKTLKCTKVYLPQKNQVEEVRPEGDLAFVSSKHTLPYGCHTTVALIPVISGSQQVPLVLAGLFSLVSPSKNYGKPGAILWWFLPAQSQALGCLEVVCVIFASSSQIFLESMYLMCLVM